MIADAMNAAALAHRVAKAESAVNSVAALGTNDAAHAAIKVREVGAMTAVVNAGMTGATFPYATKHHCRCRKSMSHSCRMKRVSNPWRARSR